jgi:hypothetical protein
MDYSKAKKWLAARGIVLSESYACALQSLVIEYQKKHMCTLNEVYALIGIKKQYIFYWRNNPFSVQTKYKTKQNVINSAGKIFQLNNDEKENLANKAGFSLYADENFAAYLAEILSAHSNKESYLRDMAMISDRMFRYIKSGKFLRKEAVLALGISLNPEIDALHVFVKKAGYVLSDSIPGDAVVKWLLLNKKTGRTNPVMYINEVLENLKLPLLMTRIKNESQN